MGVRATGFNLPRHHFRVAKSFSAGSLGARVLGSSEEGRSSYGLGLRKDQPQQRPGKPMQPPDEGVFSVLRAFITNFFKRLKFASQPCVRSTEDLQTQGSSGKHFGLIFWVKFPPGRNFSRLAVLNHLLAAGCPNFFRGPGRSGSVRVGQKSIQIFRKISGTFGTNFKLEFQRNHTSKPARTHVKLVSAHCRMPWLLLRHEARQKTTFTKLTWLPQARRNLLCVTPKISRKSKFSP